MLENNPYKCSKFGYDNTKPWGDTAKAIRLFPQFKTLIQANNKGIGEIFLFSPLRTKKGQTFITPALSTRSYFKTWINASPKKREKMFNLGESVSLIERYNDVPLFAKIIFAKSPLSLQIHDENHIENNQFISGKTEAWIALEDNVEIFLGFREGKKDEFMSQLLAFRKQFNTVEKLKTFFNFYTLKKGESVLVKPGTVHAILRGSIYEIQQPSNITKRVLEIEKKYPRKCRFNIENERDYYLYQTYFDTVPPIISCNSEGNYHFNTPYFATKLIKETQTICIDHSFSILFCPEGSMHLRYDNGKIKLNQGELALIPANYSLNIETKANSWGILSYLPAHFKDPFIKTLQ